MMMMPKTKYERKNVVVVPERPNSIDIESKPLEEIDDILQKTPTKK
jgi:hypothetical protein